MMAVAVPFPPPILLNNGRELARIARGLRCDLANAVHKLMLGPKRELRDV